MIRLHPSARRVRARRRRAFKPAVERLEDRALPSLGVVYGNLITEAMRGAGGAPARVQGFLDLMFADGSFTDVNYSGTTDASAESMRRHGERLHTFAQAYRWTGAGNPWFQQPALLERIAQGWSYFTHEAPGVMQVPNWWYRQIGVPGSLWPSLVLMRDQLDPKLLTAALDKYYATPGVWDLEDNGRAAGANLTDRARAALPEGVLRNDEARAQDVVAQVNRELLFYDGRGGEGLKQDYSLQQHNVSAGGRLYGLWHSGSYGMDYARGLARLTAWLHGSDFAFDDASLDQVLAYVLDHMQWLLRGRTFEITSNGRSLSRPGAIIGRGTELRDVAQRMLVLGRRTPELQQLIARLDSGATDDNFLHGNRALWRSDAIVHQRRHYLASVRLLSDRTVRPEANVSGENRKGYYLGDGFMTLLQSGGEYGQQPGQEIYPVWDWERLPGTTVEQTGQAPVVATGGGSLLAHSVGQGSFAGSASDGLYGVAAMDYRRATVSVTAHKAWFFFDDEVVALGAGIGAPSATHPVYTSLNQVLLDGLVTVRDADGKEQTFGDGTTLQLASPRWAHHDGMGYVFLGPNGSVTVQAQTQTGNWSDIGTSSGLVSHPVFSAWGDHGTNPEGAAYAYAVVPHVSTSELAAYHDNLPIRVLRNTAELQAVRHDGLALTQAVFYAAGSLEVAPGVTVTVDQPVLLLLGEGPDGIQITVADPTQSLAQVQVEVTLRLEGEGATWLPDQQLTRMTFDLPGGPYAGASVTRSFRSLPIAPGPRVAGVFINDGSPQRSLVTSLTAFFNGIVTLGADAFEVRDQAGQVVGLEVYTGEYEGWTWAALFFVSGPLPDGYYTLTIRGDQVHDPFGQPLDGDGDGLPGGDYVEVFFRLFGDGDGDSDVDWDDLAAFWGALYSSAADPGYLAHFDADGDGDVDCADFFEFLQRWGTGPNG